MPQTITAVFCWGVVLALPSLLPINPVLGFLPLTTTQIQHHHHHRRIMPQLRQRLLFSTTVEEEEAVSVVVVDPRVTQQQVAAIRRFQRMAEETFDKQLDEYKIIHQAMAALATSTSGGAPIPELSMATSSSSTLQQQQQPATTPAALPTPAPEILTVPPPNSSTSVANALVGTVFQLEEMEDIDTCTSEIICNEDHTVTLGETDGPLFARATGSWSQPAGQPLGDDDNAAPPTATRMEMTLRRYFDAGHEALAFTDVGEFSFCVERSYVGVVSQVGDRLAISGTIRMDIVGDEEVGYFQMIDTRADEDDDDDGGGGGVNWKTGRTFRTAA